MSIFVPEKQAQAGAVSLLLAQKVRDYFKDEQNREKFEIWYESRNGKPYECRKELVNLKPVSTLSI